MTNQEKAALLATVLPLIVDGAPLEGCLGEAEYGEPNEVWDWYSRARPGEINITLEAKGAIGGGGMGGIWEWRQVRFEVDCAHLAGQPRNAATARAAIKLAVSRLYDGPQVAPPAAELPQPKVALCTHGGCSGSARGGVCARRTPRGRRRRRSRRNHARFYWASPRSRSPPASPSRRL